MWREHGAGDDINVKFGAPFPRQLRLKPGEVPVFSWIPFESRRDRVNAAVMKAPRPAKTMDPKAMPFDVERMVYGGFTVFVDP